MQFLYSHPSKAKFEKMSVDCEINTTLLGEVIKSLEWSVPGALKHLNCVGNETFIEYSKEGFNKLA